MSKVATVENATPKPRQMIAKKYFTFIPSKLAQRFPLARCCDLEPSHALTTKALAASKECRAQNGRREVVGSVKVILRGLSELTGLGLIDWQRFPKRHVIALSDRWRNVRTMRDAKIVSVVARVQRRPPVMVPSTAASAAPERRTTPRAMLAAAAGARPPN